MYFFFTPMFMSYHQFVSCYSYNTIIFKSPHNLLHYFMFGTFKEIMDLESRKPCERCLTTLCVRSKTKKTHFNHLSQPLTIMISGFLTSVYNRFGNTEIQQYRLLIQITACVLVNVTSWGINQLSVLIFDKPNFSFEEKAELRFRRKLTEKKSFFFSKPTTGSRKKKRRSVSNNQIFAQAYDCLRSFVTTLNRSVLFRRVHKQIPKIQVVC